VFAEVPVSYPITSSKNYADNRFVLWIDFLKPLIYGLFRFVRDVPVRTEVKTFMEVAIMPEPELLDAIGYITIVFSLERHIAAITVQNHIRMNHTEWDIGACCV